MKDAREVGVPLWVLWTAILSILGSAGSVVWSSSQTVTELSGVKLAVQEIKGDLRENLRIMDAKISKNTDRIFELQNGGR